VETTAKKSLFSKVGGVGGGGATCMVGSNIDVGVTELGREGVASLAQLTVHDPALPCRPLLDELYQVLHTFVRYSTCCTQEFLHRCANCGPCFEVRMRNAEKRWCCLDHCPHCGSMVPPPTCSLWQNSRS